MGQGPAGPQGVGISNISADNANINITTTDGKSYTLTIPKGSAGVGITQIQTDNQNNLDDQVMEKHGLHHYPKDQQEKMEGM